MDISSPPLDAVPTTLNKKTISYLMDFGRNDYFSEDDTVFREGDLSKGVHIILDGQANIIKNDAFGNSNIIAVADKGAVLGEMSIFLGMQRSGSVTAKTQLSVLTLDNDDFISALQKFPDLSLRLLKSLSQKLNGANNKLSDMAHSLAMIRIGTYLLDMISGNTDTAVNCDLSEMANNTGMEGRDITNTLIGFSRLKIINALQFGEDDQAGFVVNSHRLRQHLKQASSQP